MSKLQKLVDFWRRIYSSGEPAKEKDIHDGPMPQEIQKYFRRQFYLYPEPFYGYFEEDMSDDALLLLMNPGKVEETETQQQIEKLNAFVKQRYIDWPKTKYHTEHIYLPQLYGEKRARFRPLKKEQVERIVGPVGFLHTIEFFPYHSDCWNIIKKHKEWIYDLNSQKLLVDAIIDIAKRRLVKCIFAIGIDWKEILEYYSEKYGGYYDYVMIDGSINKLETGNPAHRIFKIDLGEDAIPIIVYSGYGTNLPAAPDAIEEIRKLLKISIHLESDMCINTKSCYKHRQLGGVDDRSHKTSNVITSGRKGVTNAQMIPVMKETIEGRDIEKLSLLKESYPDVFEGSKKYLNKKHKALLAGWGY